MKRLNLALAMMLAPHALAAVPRATPARTVTDADVERIRAAEARREARALKRAKSIPVDALQPLAATPDCRAHVTPSN